jgi:hypothetical protein
MIYQGNCGHQIGNLLIYWMKRSSLLADPDKATDLVENKQPSTSYHGGKSSKNRAEVF